MMQPIPPEVPPDTQETTFDCVPSEPVHWGHLAVTVWGPTGRPDGFVCVACGKRSRTRGGQRHA